MARGSFVTIFISLLHLITATGVYYVTPDDHQSNINNDCPIDHKCHTLQYYLLNTSKYFTSNTQLHFLQGNFYINDDIVIDSLHNFSLVGSGVIIIEYKQRQGYTTKSTQTENNTKSTQTENNTQ